MDIFTKRIFFLFRRLRLTCERYNPEVRWKIPCLTSELTEKCDQKVLSDVDQSKNEAKSNLVEVQQPKSTDKKLGTKRRSNSPVNSEKSKRGMTFNSNTYFKYTTVIKKNIKTLLFKPSVIELCVKIH